MPVHTLDSLRRREEAERRSNAQNNNQWEMRFGAGYSTGNPSNPVNRWSTKHKIIYAMIGINCMTFIGWQINPNFMFKHFLLSKRNIDNGRYHVLVTSDFSHRGIVHLGFNMLSLYSNGLSILQTMSYKKFLILYLGSGIFGNLFTLFWNIKVRKKRDINSFGASGALMGLHIVLGLMHFYQQWKLHTMSEREFDKKVKRFIMESTGKEILFLLFLQAFSSRDHAGHLGGAFYGWLLWRYYL